MTNTQANASKPSNVIGILASTSADDKARSTPALMAALHPRAPAARGVLSQNSAE